METVQANSIIRTMSSLAAALPDLKAIPQLTVLEDAALAHYTRFSIGGPAAVFCDTTEESALILALEIVSALAVPHIVIGGGYQSSGLRSGL